jgi:hypothetical protein
LLPVQDQVQSLKVKLQPYVIRKCSLLNKLYQNVLMTLRF